MDYNDSAVVLRILVVTAACLTNTSAAHEQVCVEHFGLVHCVEGQAQVTIADLDSDGEFEMRLSNIGSSGGDGVVFKKGDEDWIRELSIGFNDPLMAAPEAAYIKFEGIDSSSGQIRFGLRWTRVMGEVLVDWSQAPVGVTSYTVNVYNAGVPVASVASSGPATITVPNPPQVFQWDSGTLPPEVTARFNFFEAWPASIQDSDGNVTTVTGDEIEMIAHEGADPGRIDAIRITGADVSSITIERETVAMEDGSAVAYGLVHASLGQASLQRDSDCDGQLDHIATPHLHVCNIGSSGQDGTSVDLMGFGTFQVKKRWVAPDPPATLPDGAFLELRATGQVAGAPLTQVIGSTRATVGDYDTDGNKELELTAGFSPIGSTTYTLELYNAGALMYSESGRTGPVAYTSAWPIGGGIGLPNEAEVPYDYAYILTVGTLVRVGLAGPTIACDEIRLAAENPTTIPDWLTGVDITGKDLGSLTITDEMTAPTCAKLFGITHCIEGQSDLMIADLDADGELELQASNFGSGGDAGLLKKPTKKNIEEHILKWDYSGTPPNGSYSEVVARGSVNGIPGERVIGSLRVTKVSNTAYAVTGDYSPIGGSSFTVEKWINGTLVQTQVGLSGTLLTLPTWPRDVMYKRKNMSIVLIIVKSRSEQYVLTPENPTATVDTISRLGVYGANLQSLTTYKEAILFDDGSAIALGDEITPLGQATLSMAYDCNGIPSQSIDPVVHLCNLGSNGSDGVRVNTPLSQLQTLTLEWSDPEPGFGNLSEGAYLELVATERPQGAPAEQALGSWYVTKIAPGPGELPYELSVDFSPLGVASYDLEVLDAMSGNVLYSEAGRTDPVVGTQDHWPVGGEAEIQGNVLIVAKDNSELRIAGGPTVSSSNGLEIRMIATPATLPNAISSLDLTTKDIPSLTLTGEQPPPGGAIPAVSEWGLVAMTLLVLTAGTLVYTRRPAHA